MKRTPRRVVAEVLVFQDYSNTESATSSFKYDNVWALVSYSSLVVFWSILMVQIWNRRANKVRTHAPGTSPGIRAGSGCRLCGACGAPTECARFSKGCARITADILPGACALAARIPLEQRALRQARHARVQGKRAPRVCQRARRNDGRIEPRAGARARLHPQRSQARFSGEERPSFWAARLSCVIPSVS